LPVAGHFYHLPLPYVTGCIAVFPVCHSPNASFYSLFSAHILLFAFGTVVPYVPFASSVAPSPDRKQMAIVLTMLLRDLLLCV
jgi:hypothetical protein